jgi:hypothetical protein
MEINVRAHGSGAPLQLWELGLAGFTVISEETVQSTAVRHFTFTASNTFSVTVMAKALQCRPIEIAGERRFISHWEFKMGDSSEQRFAIRLLFRLAAEPPEAPEDTEAAEQRDRVLQ